MSKKQWIWTSVYAALFSACVTLGRRITFAGDVMLKNTHNDIRPFVWSDIFVFAAVFALCAGVVAGIKYLLEKRDLKAERQERSLRDCIRMAGWTALGLGLAWMPYLLTVAPGNIYVDSLESIGQMLAHGHPTSNHHPMFYTLMVGVFLKIGSVVFGSVNIGVLLYSIFQTCVMLFVIVCVLVLLYHKRVPAPLMMAAAAYFMFMPYFPNYAMSMWKDVLYSCMLVLLSLLLYMLLEMDKPDWKWFAGYFIVGVGTMMMRNNGIYVFAAASVAAAWMLRKHAGKLIASAGAAIVLFVALTSLATALWNIQDDYVENVGIPLQQLGYTINHDGDFSEADREYLYRLAPRDVWGYAYRPCLVDPLKWNPQFDVVLLEQTKSEFFSVWLRGLIRNPGAYIDAYLLATHGFWKPFVQNLYGYMDVQMNENGYGIGFMDLFEKIFGVSLMPILKDYPIIMGSGTLLWLCLLGCLLVMMRRWKACIVYLPAMLNWATVMIATPVAYSLRYVYVFALGLPFYLLMPMLMSGKKK